MERSQSIGKLSEALAKAQAAMPSAERTQTNAFFKKPDGTFYKYADLQSVRDSVIPSLTNNGLAVTQATSVGVDGAFTLRTLLIHTSGEWIASDWPLETGKPHVMLSSLTYARRACLSSIVCLASEIDDDGNLASGVKKRKLDFDPRTPPAAGLPTVAALREDLKSFRDDLSNCQSTADVDDLVAHNHDLLSAVKSRKPDWFFGNPPPNGDVPGLMDRIEARKIELRNNETNILGGG